MQYVDEKLKTTLIHKLLMVGFHCAWLFKCTIFENEIHSFVKDFVFMMNFKLSALNLFLILSTPPHEYFDVLIS